MSLSVKSIASCAYNSINFRSLNGLEEDGPTPATPKFSIDGILCPNHDILDQFLAHLSKCSIVLFSTHLVDRVRAPSGG